jgi:hypothetical protein
LGDVTEYALPLTPLVCFFVNPFDHDTMSSVLRNIEASVQTHPREVYIVYVNMRSVNELISPFENLKQFRMVRRTRRHLILRNS